MAIRFLSSETIDGNLSFNGSTLISSNTSDGSDNAQIVITGGGAQGDTRGASVHLSGNEHGNGGLLQLRAGDGTVGGIRFYTGGSERMRILEPLITFPTITELRGDISSAAFAVGNMGDASSQMIVASRGFLTFNVSNTGSALNATERLRITATGAISVGSTGTNYGTSGQVLTSGGNSNPTWTTPTTGDVTGSGAANYVTYWTGTKAVSGSSNFQYDGAINVALGSAPTAFGSGVPNILFKGTSSTNGRAGAIWFKENDGTDTAALYVTDGNDGYGTVLTAYQGDLKLATGSLTGTKMTIQNAGDVLMGNTVVNPASGFSNQRGFGYDNSTGNLQVASTSGTAMQIGRNESTDGLILQLRKEGTVKHSIGSAESYFTGNVGIGNTSPVAKFEVTDGSSSITLQEYSNGAAIFLDGVNGDFIGGDYFHILANGNSYLGLGGYGGGTTPLNIDNTGKVGIGTTSPDRLLDVSGTGNVYAKVQSTDSTAAGIELDTAGGSTENWLIQADESIGGLAFYDLGRTSYRMVIEGNGRVGIGTTAPGAGLEVTQTEIANPTVTINNQANGGDGYVFQRLRYVASTNAYRCDIKQRVTSGVVRYAFDVTNNSQAYDNNLVLDRGNVGINIMTPSAPLHVYKSDTYSALISRADWNSGTPTKLALGKQYGALSFISTDLVETTNDTTYIALNYKSGLSSFAEGLRVYNNGNVGINNTTPTYKLSVNHGASAGGGVTTVANFSAGTGSSSGDGAQINLNNWGDNYGGFIRTVNTQGTPNYLQPKMEFGLNYNNYLPADMITRMTILGNGQVGIGTTTPNEKLVVGTTGGTQNIEISNSFIQSFNRSGSPGYNSLYFYASGYAFNVGNVGIGTTSPTATLQVGGGTANVLHKIWGSGTAGIQIFTNSPSTGTKIVALEQYFSNEGYLGLYYNGTEKVRFRANDQSYLSGGNFTVGGNSQYSGTGVTSINIQAADYPLLAFYAGTTLRTVIISYSDNTYIGHNNSSAYWQFNNGTERTRISATGTITTTGDVVAYGSPSDKTLKKNIKPLENSLDKIKSLQGVSFTWKKPGLSNIVDDIGFIAQDVKEVVPKLVRENEDGKLSMRHQGVIPILVEAMKEQQKQIDRLEEQIKKMSSKN